MFKRLFPNLAEWPVEKWIILPVVIFITWSLIFTISRDLFFDLGWIPVR